MKTELANSLLEWRKIGISLTGVVCVFSSALVFLPDSLLQKTGLIEIRNDNLVWIGLTLFVSASFFIAQLIEISAKGVSSVYRDRQQRKNFKAVIEEITPQEKQFLKEYIESGETSVSVELSHPIVSSLVARKIMVRTSSLSGYGGSFPHTLQPWARNIIIENMRLLDN